MCTITIYFKERRKKRVMDKRFMLRVAGIVAAAFVLAAGGLFAATEMPDIIKMDNEAYEKHTRAIVEFQHLKHAEEYAKKHPEFYKNGCGECHHDDNGKPLADLKPGDDVQGCIACHTKPGEMSTKEKRKMRKAKLPKKERLSKMLAYHAEAFHENCRGCHRSYNRKNKLKSKSPGYAPTTCTKCHVK